ncbi:MAG: recombination mediator RecR [Synergistaceae bacterium]|jgi:recombination protein RecR|nr:recombination mediator RecR [Synergistaceae bacterium]
MSLPDSFERLSALWGKFPGVGEKTARRMVFFMLGQDREWARALSRAITNLSDEARACGQCGNITTSDVCGICSDSRRDRSKICVVESQEDCVAMEQAGVYDGLYHVLGGRCSPLEDQEVPLESLERLKSRIGEFSVREVILALSPRIEGDMTAYAVQEALCGIPASGRPVKLSRLSYGLPVGGSIGYADRMTLHVALESRREMEEA